MPNRRAVICGALTLAACPAPVWAHQAPRVESEVVHLADGSLEITHVLQLSAAQRLLFKGGVIKESDLSGLRARAQAALYTGERFELFADDEPLTLSVLGAEIEGGHLYIYQTGNIDALPERWTARNLILRDLNPRFDNIVNVPTRDGIRTIVFDGTPLEAVKSPS